MARPDPQRRTKVLFGGIMIALGGLLLGLERKAAPTSAPAGTGSETLGYEAQDTKPSAIALVMLVSVLTIAASVVGLFVMIGHFRARDGRHAPLTSEQQAFIPPPGPPLQDHPFVDIAAERKREADLLNAYGWVDPGHTRARIPIDRAVALVLGKPLDPTP